MRNVEMEQLTSEDEWEFEVEGYNAEDAEVEPALLVTVPRCKEFGKFENLPKLKNLGS